MTVLLAMSLSPTLMALAALNPGSSLSGHTMTSLSFNALQSLDSIADAPPCQHTTIPG